MDDVMRGFVRGRQRERERERERREIEDEEGEGLSERQRDRAIGIFHHRNHSEAATLRIAAIDRPIIDTVVIYLFKAKA